MSSRAQEIDAAIQDLWERVWPTMVQRLETIERCIAEWQTGDVAGDLWRDAQQDAHQMAGSLAMFALAAASEAAIGLDHILRTGRPTAPDARALPLAAALRRGLESSRQSPRPARSPNANDQLPRPETRARVLLADDEDHIARAIQTALRFEGCDVVRARDGDEAVRFGQQQEFDLILLDVQMPRLDGFSTCQALRAYPRLETVPIVMLTGMRDPESIAECFARGATDYLAKPFEIAELRARVRTWLAHSAAEAT